MFVYARQIRLIASLVFLASLVVPRIHPQQAVAARSNLASLSRCVVQCQPEIRRYQADWELADWKGGDPSHADYSTSRNGSGHTRNMPSQRTLKTTWTIALPLTNPQYEPALGRRRLVIMGDGAESTPAFRHMAIVDVDARRVIAHQVFNSNIIAYDIDEQGDRAVFMTYTSIYLFALSSGRLVAHISVPMTPVIQQIQNDFLTGIYYDSGARTFILHDRGACVVLNSAGQVIGTVNAMGDLTSYIDRQRHLVFFTASTPTIDLSKPSVSSGTLVAVNTHTGTVLWRRTYQHLAARFTADCCGGIDPIVVDPVHNTVWLVAEGGRVMARRLDTDVERGIVHRQSSMPATASQDAAIPCAIPNCAIVEWSQPGKTLFDVAQLSQGVHKTIASKLTNTDPYLTSLGPRPWFAATTSKTSGPSLSTVGDIYDVTSGRDLAAFSVPGFAAVAADAHGLYVFGTQTRMGTDEVTGQQTETTLLVTDHTVM